MSNIILIGMPGAGKSTVGVLLAKSLKRAFLDTDLLIQAREDQVLCDIIQERGIEEFLDLEELIIREIVVQDTVIATGGSVVYRPAAMAHLQRLGCLVYLNLPLAAIAQRITNIQTRGIAMPPGQSLEALYAERQSLYRHYADLTIETTGMTAEETTTNLTRMLTKCR